MKSIYLHFPFCETKCHYCDFYSIGRERTGASDASTFESALRAECSRASSLLSEQIDTIFMGGGTPSMTDPDSMARAIEPLGLRWRAHEGTEWTMEANPSSVDASRMRAYREIGINRVSMGVQAMNDELLARLGRVHSRDRAVWALDAIFSAGIENVSVDLLCGVPGQSLQELESAMTELTRFPINHLSCYLLTLPKTHKMAKELPSDDVQLSHLLLIDEFMTSRGFEHYEISNFAKPGARARHNLAYWTGESYLGLGPSAHSFDAEKGRRWKNFSSLHKYADLLAQGESVIEWNEELTDSQRELERWMLGLRLSDGVPRDWLNTSARQETARVLEVRGLVRQHPRDERRIQLTPRGFALSDQVIGVLA